MNRGTPITHKLFAALVCALVCLQSGFAQQRGGDTATISGRVVDAQGANVAGAVVTLYARAGATTGRVATVTDEAGAYRFARLAAPDESSLKLRRRASALGDVNQSRRSGGRRSRSTSRSTWRASAPRWSSRRRARRKPGTKSRRPSRCRAARDRRARRIPRSEACAPCRACACSNSAAPARSPDQVARPA